jgi:hypothetical protein
MRDAATARVEDEDVQRAHDELVRAALPVKLRGRLEQHLATVPITSLDHARLLAALERTADRAALLVGGDPATIVARATARKAGTAHLIAAVAAPGWLALRARLGVGVR